MPTCRTWKCYAISIIFCFQVSQLDGETCMQNLGLAEDLAVESLTSLWSEPHPSACTQQLVATVPSQKEQHHVKQQQLMSTSPMAAASATAVCCFSIPSDEKTFQFDLESIPCTSTTNQFAMASPTPNNTPANTPAATPDSSNPSSPKGSSYGSVPRKSPTAKLKMLDGQSATQPQKIPRHKRESHKRAEQKRRYKNTGENPWHCQEVVWLWPICIFVLFLWLLEDVRKASLPV